MNQSDHYANLKLCNYDKLCKFKYQSRISVVYRKHSANSAVIGSDIRQLSCSTDRHTYIRIRKYDMTIMRVVNAILQRLSGIYIQSLW